jgi:ABC-type multidrug transport system ATPase subunit
MIINHTLEGVIIDMIDVKHLTKSFGETVAVKDVSFSVKQGEVLGFLGPNGAGKTTTMRILAGFLSADEGEANIAGFDVFDQSLEVRKHIGYLPESAPLYMDLNVLESPEKQSRPHKPHGGGLRPGRGVKKGYCHIIQRLPATSRTGSSHDS